MFLTVYTCIQFDLCMTESHSKRWNSACLLTNLIDRFVARKQALFGVCGTSRLWGEACEFELISEVSERKIFEGSGTHFPARTLADRSRVRIPRGLKKCGSRHFAYREPFRKPVRFRSYLNCQRNFAMKKATIFQGQLKVYKLHNKHGIIASSVLFTVMSIRYKPWSKISACSKRLSIELNFYYVNQIL